MTQLTSNVLTFQADLERLAWMLDVELPRVVRKVAIDLFGRVVELTPVDTGRARASWTIQEGTPNLTPQAVGVYSEFQGNPQGVAVQQAGSLLGGQTLVPIFIANGLPYIARLNDGHSQQAPAGFVEAAVAEAEAGIDAELEAAVVFDA